MIGIDELRQRFTYHSPKPGQPEVYQSLRAQALELAQSIDVAVPDSREKSTALSRFEEAIFYANAGIARRS